VSRDPATRARAACALGDALSIAGELERAEALVAGGLAELPEAPRHALTRVYCLLRASSVARNAEDPERGLAFAEEARRRLAASGQGSPLLALRVDMDVAEARRTFDDLRGAEREFAAAHARLEELGLDRTETAGTLLNNWALVLSGLGRPLEAERQFRRAIDLSSGGQGAEGDVSPMLRINHGRALAELGRFSEAAESCARGHAEAKRIGDELAVTFALFAWSLVETRAGHLEIADRKLDELEGRIESLPADHHFRGAFASQRGLLAHSRGELGRARSELDRAFALIDASPQRRFGLPGTLLRRSALALDEGASEAALADARLALDLERSIAGEDAASCRLGRAHVAVGRALEALGDRAGALAEAGRGADQLARSLGSASAEAIEARGLAEGRVSF
jgi:tetratricopeptide (TPR) repeat protein